MNEAKAKTLDDKVSEHVTNIEYLYGDLLSSIKGKNLEKALMDLMSVYSVLGQHTCACLQYATKKQKQSCFDNPKVQKVITGIEKETETLKGSIATLKTDFKTFSTEFEALRSLYYKLSGTLAPSK